MASNYPAIRTDNKRRYGTDIGRIGRMLLADRYADRAHFIFELLQNAEDALGLRTEWQEPREVRFDLSATELRISHWGQPFDEPHVRAICGIDESTKPLTSIGRFGIGFKSVYAFTDRPEVHSGDENFAIESFVWPVALQPISRSLDETVFIIPLRSNDAGAHDEITNGLRQLGARTLLFLRQIEEISWKVEGGPSGLYLRSEPEMLGENVRRVTVVGQAEDEADIEETWLLFARQVRTDEGEDAGNVEIAFSLTREESGQQIVQPLHDSPLVVFFPTVLETHLGFLLQGPYRTTPSRDNVKRNDPWNQHLVEETVTLLVEALRWFRAKGMLDTAVLQCLPLDSTKVGGDNMFAPLFYKTKAALKAESFLPRYGGGYTSASSAKLARTQEIRELFNPRQLASLFGHDGELAWLSEEITQDRTPEIRRYLMREMDVAEVTPEVILSRLDKTFLEAQPDHWIRDLYEFLHSQRALRGRAHSLPLVRLEDGSHVIVRSYGKPKAFLPSPIRSGFPTVRRRVCDTDASYAFLQSLGLTEPDPVDDVAGNVLPKYRVDEADVDEALYKDDIRRILAAFKTDSKTQREKLINALRESSFIRAVDAGDKTKKFAKPGEVYLPTERLKNLFEGISNLFLVDDSCDVLCGEEIRDLLEACGVTRHLRPQEENRVSEQKKRELRERAGSTGTKSPEQIRDYSLHGLESLLYQLPSLDQEQQRRKAQMLWKALADLERRHKHAFTGSYQGRYYSQTKTCDFDPAFIELLQKTAWVPNADGKLQRPEFVVFDTLGWNANPFLLSKIKFKPPIIETLAREAGIEPSMLDLLRELGVTSEAELRARLGIKDEPEQHPDAPDAFPSETRKGNGSGDSSASRNGGTKRKGARGGSKGGRSEGGRDAGGRSLDGTGARPFISYVAAHPNEDEPDPDGLDQQTRMALEEAAIQFILDTEPELKRTPPNNPGYDLFETDAEGQTMRWIEVKAMTGSLSDRPVGLSRTQFEYACSHHSAYWIYIVENAEDAPNARILRIQDPIGKAQNFTFDHGWIAVAEVDDE